MKETSTNFALFSSGKHIHLDNFNLKGKRESAYKEFIANQASKGVGKGNRYRQIDVDISKIVLEKHIPNKGYSHKFISSKTKNYPICITCGKGYIKHHEHLGAFKNGVTTY